MGDKLLFKQVGAYSLVKANRFNGYNLPDIYALEAGRPTLLKNYRYQDYRGQW
jgi:carboxynorspermidine decarboxylase